ncbi:YycC family protein [Paenibacillus athensensis]|uniref:YycC family protein n=1 Tax=Paenibacillus athensensis TaxID=1967502 RepID=A0A4Y8Q5Z2_9BACL|nr:YycC family protein [Paenibacillus athensensis]MCD1259854.1 YycC family protein [Paenibacillus athensensis]
MKPLQISAETAQKLAAELKVPLEHLMHMPQHILLQKLAELAKSSSSEQSPATPDANRQDVE